MALLPARAGALGRTRALGLHTGIVPLPSLEWVIQQEYSLSPHSIGSYNKNISSPLARLGHTTGIFPLAELTVASTVKTSLVRPPRHSREDSILPSIIFGHRHRHRPCKTNRSPSIGICRMYRSIAAPQ
eukprot:5534979-Pyramimonas_sp.AAC.1